MAKTKEISKPDVANADNPDLESAIQSKLDAIVDREAEALDEGDDVVDEKVDETEAEVDDTEENAEPDTESDDSDEDSPTLPSGYRRAALARGYTNDEINHFLKTKPEEAQDTFKEIYTDWRQENSMWSRRGRELAEAQRKSQKKTEPAKQADEDEPDYTVDLLKREDFGVDDDRLDKIIEAVNAKMSENIERLAGPIKQSQDALAKQQQENLQRESEEFFHSSEMKNWKENYGELGKLTEQQFNKRMELFDEAQVLVCGAMDHGREMNIQDALTRAHAQLTYQDRDESIRQQIRESMKKRTKMEKSSHQQGRADGGEGPLSDDEFEAKVARGLERLKTKT